MEGNLINNWNFLTYVIFVRRRLLLFLGRGVNKPSYATGAWPACIDYRNKLHLIWCMMYATTLNVCSSIDIWYVTSRCNCYRPMMPQLHWNTLENFGCKMIGTYISVISVYFALIKHLITNTRNIQQVNLPDVYKDWFLHSCLWWPFPSRFRMFHPDSAWKR